MLRRQFLFTAFTATALRFRRRRASIERFEAATSIAHHFESLADGKTVRPTITQTAALYPREGDTHHTLLKPSSIPGMLQRNCRPRKKSSSYGRSGRKFYWTRSTPSRLS